ncbi:MAG: hypothetical protein E5W02_05165 [Mesorhizobium sp.]|nr:MAG: hypothetical protein E5W02_05165 [Mesorhizobium sp.]
MRRKEIENYLLEIGAIERAIRKRAIEKSVKIPNTQAVIDWLDEITATMKDRVLSQVLEKAELFYKREQSKDQNIAKDDLLDMFKEKWKNFEGRAEISPGKELLSRLNERLQDDGIGHLTLSAILQEMKDDDLDPFFRDTLSTLDRFCE